MPYYNPAHAEVSPARPAEICFACICFDLPWNMMRVNLAFIVWDKPNISPWVFEPSWSHALCLVTYYICYLYALFTIGEKENTVSIILNPSGQAQVYFLSGFLQVATVPKSASCAGKVKHKY